MGEGFMKCVFETGTGAMIYVRSFIKIGSDIQKLMMGDRQDRQHGDLISIFVFFQNKKSRLNT
jgi:hypothetical protein